MSNILGNNLIFLLILVFWVLPWKAYAMWIASKNNHKWWFFILLVFNTMGILEIIYIFAIAKKKYLDIKNALFGLFTPKKKAQ